jgi:cbb3-type cytochrome oxidase subunit 1
MFVLSRWFIKSSLVFFVLALLAGLLLAADGLWGLPAFVGALSPVYFHLFLVGWITQLIFGVVYWMFPKASLEKPRGNEQLAWATFWLLNVGLALRIIGEPLTALTPPASAWGWLLAISALLQWLAGLFFVANTWVRVKEK